MYNSTKRNRTLALLTSQRYDGVRKVVPMSFAEMLRVLRTEKGWTQEELADKSGVPLWTIRSYEIGQREAGWRALLDLCKALGVDPRVFDPCVPGETIPKLQRGRPRKDAAPPKDSPPLAAKSKGRKKP